MTISEANRRDFCFLYCSGFRCSVCAQRGQAPPQPAQFPSQPVEQQPERGLRICRTAARTMAATARRIRISQTFMRAPPSSYTSITIPHQWLRHATSSPNPFSFQEKGRLGLPTSCYEMRRFNAPMRTHNPLSPLKGEMSPQRQRGSSGVIHQKLAFDL